MSSEPERQTDMQEESRQLSERVAELEHEVAELTQLRARLQYEQERNHRLTERLRLLEGLIAQAPLDISVGETQGTCWLANQHLAGDPEHTDTQELISKPLDQLFPPELCETLYASLQEIYATSEAIQCEYAVTRPEGTRTMLSLQFPIRDEQGHIYAIGYMAIDVTAYKQLEENLRKFQRAVEQSPVSVIITGTLGAIEYVNPKFTLLTGYTSEEVKGRNPRILKSGDTPREVYAELWRAITSGQEWQGEFRNVRKNGGSYWERASISPIFDSAGAITHFVGLKEDITDQKRADAEMKRLNEQLTHSVTELAQHNRAMTLLNRLSSFLQRSQSPDEAYAVSLPLLRELFVDQDGALYIINTETNLLELVGAWGQEPPVEQVIDPRTCWAFAGGRMYVIDDPHDELVCEHIDAANAFPSLCIQLITKGEPLGLLHVRKMAASSEQARIHREHLTMMVADTLALALTNLHLQQERLREYAVRDQVTGLFNRSYLEELLERELRRAARHQYCVGIILLEIDHFKRYRDIYGHNAGDALLRATSTWLRNRIRAEDVACRFSEAAIILILPGASLEDSHRRAKALYEDIQEFSPADALPALEHITFSFGVSSFPQHGQTAEDVIAASNIALQEARASERNQLQDAEG